MDASWCTSRWLTRCSTRCVVHPLLLEPRVQQQHWHVMQRNVVVPAAVPARKSSGGKWRKRRDPWCSRSSGSQLRAGDVDGYGANAAVVFRRG
jgi:hypothetical protein